MNQRLEQSNSLIYKIQNPEESYSEDFVEVQKIIGELQIKKPEKEDINYIEEETDKDKENEILQDSQNELDGHDNMEEFKIFVSPINNSKHLGPSEVSKILMQEQKSYELIQQNQKEYQSIMALDTLKIQKSNLEDLRNRDIEKIKELTPRNGAESEIFSLFQNIINRRYEKINSMFDENIRAVQEALAQSVISEESSIAITGDLIGNLAHKYPNDENFQTFGWSIKESMQRQKNKEFINEINKIHEHNSPEPLEMTVSFAENSKALSKIIIENEPAAYIFLEKHRSQCIDTENYQNNSKISPIGSSSIVWIDEVCMPSNIDFTDLIIDAAISEIHEYLFEEIFQEM